MTFAHRSLAASVLALLQVAVVHAEFEVPANDNYVTQLAPILTATEEQDLEEKLAAFDQETSNQVAILIVETLDDEPSVDAAVAVGRTWDVGTKEHRNGIVMLAALKERIVEIQVSDGLQGALPDIVTKGIIEEDIVPAFADGMYYEGLDAAIESIKKHVDGEYTADRYESSGSSDFIGFLAFFGFIFLQYLGATLSRSKSWWAGGAIGGGAGLILALIWSWWAAIPVLIGVGLLFDYIVSKHPNAFRNRGGRGPWSGGGFGGRGGSSGGFGGFGGGGSGFDGGGARGRW